MSDLKTSELPVATTPLSGDEQVPLVQGGVTKRGSVNDLTAAAVNAAQQARDEAEAYAQIAAALIGPIYGSASAGLAATQDGDEFAVDALNGTATIYLNDNGTAVATRAVILNPTAPSAAALIGTLDGNLQEVLTDILTRLAALEA